MQARPRPDDARSHPPASRWAESIAIAGGGALGASLRYAIALGTAAGQQHTALAAILANLIGALLLGILFARVDSAEAHPLLRPFLVIGVFGSFTTFSALALDNRALATQQGEIIALLHIVGTIVLGLLVFVVGAAIARRPG